MLESSFRQFGEIAEKLRARPYLIHAKFRIGHMPKTKWAPKRFIDLPIQGDKAPQCTKCKMLKDGREK